MQTLDSFVLLEASQPTTSPVISIDNSGGADSLSIEIFGNASDFIVELQGRVNKSNPDWTKLMVVNLSDYSTTNEITINGIYNTSLLAVSEVQLELKSITTGNLKVHCIMSK